jgi:hypothetical protein
MKNRTDFVKETENSFQFDKNLKNHIPAASNNRFFFLQNNMNTTLKIISEMKIKTDSYCVELVFSIFFFMFVRRIFFNN